MQEKMYFTRMDQGTDEDFQILKRVHEDTLKQLPDRMLAMLGDLSGDQASIGETIVYKPRRGQCATARMKNLS